MSVSKSLVPILRQVPRAGGLLRLSKCQQRFYSVNRHNLSALTAGFRPFSLHRDARLFPTMHCWQFLHTETERKAEEKPGLIKRFKQMYKDYWYVLVPVHVVTSCIWFGSFYYASSSGVDIAAVLEWMNLSESIVGKFNKGANTTAGHLAVSYLLYKIFTPLRYTVTLGGTTYTINFLTKKGYIDSVPSTGDIKQMIRKKTDSIREKRDQLKDNVNKKKNLLPPLEQKVQQ